MFKTKVLQENAPRILFEQLLKSKKYYPRIFLKLAFWALRAKVFLVRRLIWNLYPNMYRK